ncbi:YdgA family protein [Kordiimonas sp. SCSIO 12610]|uniref:YdgA family protein n=1 Tax=Kordiimonas sp. SCSIO 12610 TaxID=2829597 RepID=UPI002109E275|nr:YdgA family protein [Kordiimonas sp. SCSIO 12610]UTW54466.1 hypothetical protein KFF44_11700 [Kordiimonas sp. SCSIO 12610]
MNSKAKLLLGTGIVIVLGVGAYTYLGNQVEISIQSEIQAFNETNKGKYNISYDSIDANPALGKFNLKGVSLELTEIGGTSFIENATLQGSVKDGSFVLTGVSADTFKLESDKANITFSEFNLTSPDLAIFGDEDKLKKLREFPINSFHVKDVKIDATSHASGQSFEMSLDEYTIDVDESSQALEKFELTDLQFKTVINNILPMNMNYGNIVIKGGDLSWFGSAIELSQNSLTNDLDNMNEAEKILELQKAQSVIMKEMMPVFLNYMGIDSFEWSDFSVSLPNGSDVSFDRLYVEDLKRTDNIVVGSKSGWDNLAIPDLTGLDPNFDAQLNLIGLKGTSLSMVSETAYDQNKKTNTSNSQISIENILEASVDFTLNDFEPKTYYQSALAIYSPEIQQNPDKVIELYTSLFNNFSGNITLTDKSIINRFINGYAKQTGADPEALRAQFTGLVIANLTQSFGSYAPQGLAEAISGYMAASSTPIKLELATKQKLTPETVNQISATNWGDYIKVDLKQAN